MNPLKQFRNYFIGEALAQSKDVFGQARVQVLFSFTVFFLILNIPYTALSFTLTPFHQVLACSSTIALIIVLAILKKASVKWAIYFYVFNHITQNLCHFFMNNGRVEMQGILFFILIIFYGFLLLDRKWGFSLLLLILSMYFVGVYNENSNFSLFKVPDIYADPVSLGIMKYFTIIPLILNVFLISQFVKAQQKAEEQIRNQKETLEVKNKDITDSINYAKKIQTAVLPNEETIYRSIPLSFIVYKPRDIVSGDFFWFHEIDDKNYIIVCADCTGHGVPGAFMTVIGSSLLNQIVIESKITQPSAILTELDKRITLTLKQEKERLHTIHDGMDLSLIKVDKQKKEFTVTSAKRPVLFIRDKQMQEFKGSKFSLGGMRSGEKVFTETKMNYEEDDILYFYSDGYTDQFGGEKGKKFSSKRLKELLLSLHLLPVSDQKSKLEKAIENWRGNLEQVDDIQLIGIRF